MSDRIDVSKIEMIKSIVHCLKATSESLGFDKNKYNIDEKNERVIVTQGMLLTKKEISNKSFDEMINSFLSRDYK